MKFNFLYDYYFIVSSIFDPAEVSTWHTNNKSNEIDRNDADVCKETICGAHKVEDVISTESGLGNNSAHALTHIYLY